MGVIRRCSSSRVSIVLRQILVCAFAALENLAAVQFLNLRSNALSGESLGFIWRNILGINCQDKSPVGEKVFRTVSEGHMFEKSTLPRLGNAAYRVSVPQRD